MRIVQVNCAQMVEPIEMPVGGPINLVLLVDRGSRSLHMGRATFGGHVLDRCNVFVDECIAFTIARGDRCAAAMRPQAKLL